MASVETIDLYLYATHEIPTWQPIVAALRAAGADPRFVLEPPAVNLARGTASDPTRGWLDDKATHAAPLVDARTYDALAGQLAASGEVPLDRLRSGADAAVTSAGARWLRPWSGARIRCMYGVGLVAGAWGHGVINQGFDLVLAPGEFSRREIARSSPDTFVEAVGYPKWAAYRRGEVTKEGARSRLGIGASGRPVVLWLPTWADHSSLDTHAGAFEALADRYDVVVKPHHNSVRFEQPRLDRLGEREGVMVVATSTDLRDLAAAADVVVSDVRSGGLTEGLLADRPVVALVDGARTPDHLHPDGAAAVELCSGPEALGPAVERVLGDGRADARHALVADLFGPSTGDDAERAAAAVLAVVERVGHPVRRRVEAPAWLGAYRVARRSGR